MMSPAEFRTLADQAFADADEYCIEADRSREPRRSLLLKWADQREADGEHYKSRAEINEAFDAMRSKPKMEKAA